jgi:hypothetical protein
MRPLCEAAKQVPKKTDFRAYSGLSARVPPGPYSHPQGGVQRLPARDFCGLRGKQQRQIPKVRSHHSPGLLRLEVFGLPWPILR